MNAATGARSPVPVLGGLVALALGWRLLLAARTPVPSEDGVSYLWMAEQFARGDFTTPMSEVFPPLLPLLVAPFVHFEILLPGTPYPVHGGQLALALLGALAVLPIARLGAALAGGDRGALLASALLASLAGLPARVCAEVYTEPVFALAMACATLAALRGAFWQSGAWAGAGFWLRPEALLLPAAFCLLEPRRAWRSVALAALAAVLLACWRAAAGHGFDLLPKLAFNLDKARLGAEVAALPRAWLEAFGVAGLLALFGIFLARRQAAARPLALALLMAVLVVAMFAVRRRFLVAWWPLVLPFAMVALAQVRWRWRAVLLAAALAFGIASGWRTTDPDRAAEREVGAWIGARLRPGERVVTDLTRVLYFAGARPLPPRHVTAAELIAAARAPDVRFLVLGSRRPAAGPVAAALPQFVPAVLPAGLAAGAAARGIEVRVRE